MTDPSPMNVNEEPSPQARRAADELAAWMGDNLEPDFCVTDHEFERMAEIVERETGVGEIIALVRECCGDHVDWLIEAHEVCPLPNPMDEKFQQKLQRLRELINPKTQEDGVSPLSHSLPPVSEDHHPDDSRPHP